MATRSREKSAERAKNKDLRPTASAKYIRIAPNKVRIVLDTIRGKDVNTAIAMLEATPKSASEAIIKVINSAAANAEHNQNLSRADLYIDEIYADGGPVLKRIQPRARGSAYQIKKRTSHITVKLDTKEAK